MTRAFAQPALMAGLLLGAAGLATVAATAPVTAQDSGGLVTYKNDRHGFTLTYPSGRLIAFPPATPDGLQWVSKDGKARVLVGTLSNFDGKSLADYRAFLLNESYPGAKVTYAPVRDKAASPWFVLSGIRADGVTAFYQRVNFVCGGKNINSWTVVFPDADKKEVYSPMIEQVHRDYKLGNGNCGTTATPKQARANN
jgi:hypothetical protein